MYRDLPPPGPALITQLSRLAGLADRTTSIVPVAAPRSGRALIVQSSGVRRPGERATERHRATGSARSSGTAPWGAIERHRATGTPRPTATPPRRAPDPVITCVSPD